MIEKLRIIKKSGNITKEFIKIYLEILLENVDKHIEDITFLTELYSKSKDDKELNKRIEELLK